MGAQVGEEEEGEKGRAEEWRGEGAGGGLGLGGEGERDEGLYFQVAPGESGIHLQFLYLLLPNLPASLPAFHHHRHHHYFTLIPSIPYFTTTSSTTTILSVHHLHHYLTAITSLSYSLLHELPLAPNFHVLDSVLYYFFLGIFVLDVCL